MTDERWTKANKLTEITKHEVRRLTVGIDDELIPKGRVFDDAGSATELSEGDSVWAVWFEAKTGLDEREFGMAYFASEKAAHDQTRLLPKGTIFGDAAGYPTRIRAFMEDYRGDKRKALSLMFSKGSSERVELICYEALHGAGVLTDYWTSAHVLDWVGEGDVAWMKSEFGENWSALAEYEYCLHHFPKSSLASLAAHLRLCTYVTLDEFTEGYLARQIEAVYYGTEQVVQSAIKVRKRAGVGGGQASARLRQQRLETFMREIENLADLATRMPEPAIVTQAFANASEKMDKFWKLGGGQAEKYAVYLRSEEPFKTRYFSIFAPNA